jgi:hypothetical protein
MTCCLLACGSGVVLETGEDAGADAGAGTPGDGADVIPVPDGSPSDVLSGSDVDSSSYADGSLDAGTFACGDGTCHRGEVCVHPPCGCVLPVIPITDSGMCPDGAVFADGLDRCVPVHITCQPAYCWSPSPSESTLDCTGQEGSLSGVIRAVPAGSDPTCYALCI